ncbi:hypothetical protein GCM10009721_32580 [Terrabacter tumescens]|uniref:Uncharacterized protein n=2 Tax=Terrabacter tumescens TaxID=60443 RepID=A0ABQ2I7I4_9MICO|nr:hypothetical protein GCM10009721_32580 [Terrabacter tumescens]
MRMTTTWTTAIVASLAISGITGAAAASAASAPQMQTQTQSQTRAGSAFVAADGHTYDYASGTTSDPRAAALLAKVRSLLPADWRARQAAALSRFGVEPSAAQDALGRAIDPTQYQCAPTRLDAFVDGIIADIDPSSLFVLSMLGGFDFPTYDALLFGSQGDALHALTKSSRNELTSSFRAAQKFWDTDGSDIQLMAMHGDVMRDPARLTRLIAVLYGVPDSDAAELAGLVVDVVTSDPGLDGGDNPIFTLNAFAFSGAGDPDPIISSLPDKLVFGDGILEALDAIGVGDVGPRAVLGHEYGHHVQYDKDLFASPLTGPEATRRTELMADAFGTYFVTHKRGLALNTKRVLEAEQSFYQVGDCSFTSAGHHGTPNQRLRASTWGASVAADAQKQGQVLPSLTLDSRFESVLPQFVAPDA